VDAQRCYVHSTLPRRFQVGMWNDVRLTKHRLQIRASDIKVHNPRLNVQLLNVWSLDQTLRSCVANKSSQGDHIVLYTQSRACTCSNESGETEHSIHGMEARWKLKACLTTCAVSHLTHLAWENVTTNITRSGRSVPTIPGHRHRTLCVSN